MSVSGVSEPSKEDVLAKYGITSTLVMFDYAFMIPASLAGLVLSVISMVIFTRLSIKTRLYKYLAMYSLNGAIVCVLNLCQYIGHRGSVSENEEMMWFHTYCVVPALLATYWFGSLMDILIILDRIPNALVKFRAFVNRFNTIKQCVVLIIMSIAVTLIYYVIFTTGHETQRLRNGQHFTIWFITLTDFGKTRFSYISGMVVSVFRDEVIMLIQIYLNIMSIRQIKKQLRMKRNNLTTASFLSHSRCIRVDIKTSVMVVCLCYLSVVEHLITSISSAYNLKDIYEPNAIWSLKFMFFSWSLKRVLDFFLFVIFNNVFRKCLFQKLTCVSIE